ncbi:hypothetical protein F01_490206 [Burkholderia cenocepacia]|nr:hypothetical protein F01_490206 [Burkholderia cenocepacia]
MVQHQSVRWGDDFQVHQATENGGDGGGRAGARQRGRACGATGRQRSGRGQRPGEPRREARAAAEHRRPARAGSRALHRREYVPEHRGAREERCDVRERVHAGAVGFIPGPRRARDGRLAEDGRPVLRRVVRPQPVRAE